MSLEVERHTDWMRSPGSLAVLTFGPFIFWLNTADGLAFGFALRVKSREYGWSVGRRQND